MLKREKFNLKIISNLNKVGSGGGVGLVWGVCVLFGERQRDIK